RPSRALCQPVHVAPAGRHHHYRHAAGRGHGQEAASISEARRHHAPHRRWSRRAEPEGRGMVRTLTAAAVLAGLAFGQAVAAPLTQIGSIPLGDAKGAIADLGMDYANQRLFVLEPDAGTLAVVDLAGAKLAQSVTGLAAPRGLARAPTDNRLYVSTAGGKLMIYAGAPPTAAGTGDVGANQGMLHYDAGSERIYLALGGKKIAIIDSTHNKHWDNIRLNAEPGPLVLEDNGSRIFVGAASEPRILVADRDGN